MVGFNAAIDDGNPYAQPGAFRSGGTQSVTYPNEQPASLLWYHDHYLGDTRMNVVAGLAGGYLLRDGFDKRQQPAAAGTNGRTSCRSSFRIASSTGMGRCFTRPTRRRTRAVDRR